jgi:hypothetical protein
METLMLLTYAALCIVVFKVFRIPLNKWTVPTAVLGGHRYALHPTAHLRHNRYGAKHLIADVGIGEVVIHPE